MTVLPRPRLRCGVDVAKSATACAGVAAAFWIGSPWGPLLGEALEVLEQEIRGLEIRRRLAQL
jgi:hypothetical protein